MKGVLAATALVAALVVVPVCLMLGVKRAYRRGASLRRLLWIPRSPGGGRLFSRFHRPWEYDDTEVSERPRRRRP